MDDKPVLGYFTSAYARAADTFIRGEVRELRAMGFTIHTFSVRRSEPEQMVSDDVRREQSSTEYLLDRNTARLFWALGCLAITRPLKLLNAITLSQRCSPPGLKPRIWHLVYVLEASYLARRLEAKGIRHLHNHIGENSATIAMLASELTGIPFSLTIHGPVEFDGRMQLAPGGEDPSGGVRGCHQFVWSKSIVAMVRCGKLGKIRIIHCGVAEEFLRHPLTPVPRVPRLVSIGRLCEQKGQLILIEAAAALAQEGTEFELVLVGDGPLRAIIEAAISRHGLGRFVRLVGWKDSSAIRQELLESRALILPSFAEGLPVVIMESLALGRPVLTTAIAGIPELVKDGINGWLVPAGSATALADGMRRLLNTSVDDLDKMGKAGALAVQRQHSASSEAAKLARLLTASATNQPLPLEFD